MTQHIPLTLDEVAKLSDAARTTLFLTKPEVQHFDRKSPRISPADLGDALTGFANAEGGVIVVGVHDKKIQGLTARQSNDLSIAPRDFVDPPAHARVRQLTCLDANGNSAYVLVFEVEADGRLHKNRAGDVFLRIGDRTKRLNPLEAQELAYEKGAPNYDGQILSGATLPDLDPARVAEYVKLLSHTASPNEALRARGLLKGVDGQLFPTVAALLLFGRSAQAHLPQARLRSRAGVRPRTT